MIKTIHAARIQPTANKSSNLGMANGGLVALENDKLADGHNNPLRIPLESRGVLLAPVARPALERPEDREELQDLHGRKGRGQLGGPRFDESFADEECCFLVQFEQQR